MAGIWEWIIDLGNSKMVALILFMSTFIGILLYVFSPSRSRELESHRFIPLDDDDSHLDPHAVSDSKRHASDSVPETQTPERRPERDRKS